MQKQAFNNKTLEGYIRLGLNDINEEEPETQYRLERFPKTNLLLQAALIELLKARGLLHLRNQISYNDAGLSVNLDDKAPYYMQWAQMEQQEYLMNKKRFKSKHVPSFYGVHSPLEYY